VVIGASTPRANLRGPAVNRGGALLVVLLLALALAVGTLSTTNPYYAVGIVVAVGTALLIVADIRMLPSILVVAVYAEGISVGGFNLGRVVGVLTLAAVCYYLLAGGRADLRPNALLTVGLALGLWILLSLYWAANSHFVILWFLKWSLSCAFAIAFAVLVRTEQDVRRVLAAFVAAAITFGSLALLQSFSAGGSMRSSGLTGDPNQFASFQALAVGAALVLSCRERLPHRRLVYYGAIALIALSIGSSYSRGGIITLVVVVLATLVTPWRTFFRSRSQKAVFTLMLVAAAWSVALIGSAAYQQRLSSIFTGSDRGSGRTDLWAAAWNGYKQHRYFGLGAGGFEAASLDLLHSTPGVDITASYVAPDRPVHNAYLEALTDLGPVGLALFLAVIVLTFAYLVRCARRFRARGEIPLQRMSVALIVALVGLSASILFLSIGLGHMLWIFVGLALALDRMSVQVRSDANGAHTSPSSRPVESPRSG
jgi:O-antigen ligase